MFFDVGVEEKEEERPEEDRPEEDRPEEDRPEERLEGRPEERLEGRPEEDRPEERLEKSEERPEVEHDEGPNEGIAVELLVKCEAGARAGLAFFISEGDSGLFQRIKFANWATGVIVAGIIYP
jgi:hypothetical protein